MAVSYNIATHGVCFPTKILSGNIGHVLNITIDKDMDNGSFVKVGDWIELDRYKADTATTISAVVRGKSARGNWYVEITGDCGDTVLLYQDPIIEEANWGKRWLSEANFYNAKGDTVRAYPLEKYDIIELSYDSFDGVPTVGSVITSVSNGKMSVGSSSSNSVVGNAIVGTSTVSGG